MSELSALICRDHTLQWLVLMCLIADCPRTEYCSITLNDDSYQAFLYAIRNHYWYQMYIDDLPIWGAYCRLLRILFMYNICRAQERQISVVSCVTATRKIN